MGLSMADAFTEALRLSRLIDDGIDALKRHSVALAEAERAYRLAKSRAWIEARVEGGTVPEREAWVNGQCADLRYRRDLEDGMRQSALEAVRSRRTQVSAIQSILAAERAEAEFSRTGPHAT